MDDETGALETCQHCDPWTSLQCTWHSQVMAWSLSSSSFPPVLHAAPLPPQGREVGNVCQVGSVWCLQLRPGPYRSQWPLSQRAHGQGCRAKGDRKGGGDRRQVGSRDAGTIRPSSQQEREQPRPEVPTPKIKPGTLASSLTPSPSSPPHPTSKADNLFLNRLLYVKFFDIIYIH